MKAPSVSPASASRVYFFESHPVQYKAPVYQALQRILPDSFEVIYATDASLRKGNVDVEFGTEVVWDTPLMCGYPFRVLNNENGVPLRSPKSLTGRGIFSLLFRDRPPAVVITHFRYRFDQAAYLAALALRIPILIRQETQDAMFAAKRSWLKNGVRSITYRALYSPIQHAFAFGVLNHQHLRRHGVRPECISFARFSVPDPFETMAATEMVQLRRDVRNHLQIPDGKLLVAFVGKFIPQKAPHLLFDSVKFLPREVQNRLHLVLVGSGKLLDLLKSAAQEVETLFGVRSTFTGFVNQSQLPGQYLAADIIALPSPFEAWGLVINEALNAGCAAIVSKSVGCQHEFSGLERMRVIETGDARQLARAIAELARFPRNFLWARPHMKQYSSVAAARAIADRIQMFLK